MAVAKGTTKTRQFSWHAVPLAPIVLVTGSEGLLVDRAIATIRSKARAAAENVEITGIDAGVYNGGEIDQLASPSLFGEPRVIIAVNASTCSDAFVADITRYLRSPADDVTLLVHHSGGNRAKSMVDALKKHPTTVHVDCQPIKKDAEKISFVGEEFSRFKRTISAEATRALIDAVGTDLRELAGACGQLATDVPGREAITVQDVNTYHGGRVEATGFQVADELINGRGAQALAKLRQALSVGVDPVPIIAALAMRFRSLAKVAAASGGGSHMARDLGMAPWQIDRARRELRAWSAPALGACMVALAEADEMVKGAGRDPHYAVERAVTTIARLRAAQRGGR